MRRAVVAVIALVAGACVKPVPYSDNLPTRDLAAGDTVAAQVLANAGEWRNTGAVVRNGVRYRIRAEGRWRAHPLCNYTGPGGDGMYVGLCIPWDVGKVLTSHPHQALLARIGEVGTPFAVGSLQEFVADRDGLLFLHMNESPDTGDNEGVLTATISLAEPAPAAAKAPPSRPQPAPSPSASMPALAAFPKAAERPDDIAVIIGNANYAKGRDIPNVGPAHADATAFKAYALSALGIREGNIIDLRDASQADLISVFGNADNPKGRLFNWVLPGVSRVHVYYAGHGAPAGRQGAPFLVPVDADAATIELNGYPLDVLYRNLAKLPAASVTVVLEACFSGGSPEGPVIAKASGIWAVARTAEAPANVTVIAAGSPEQMASWEQDGSHGLFTKYYLLGMSGEADRAPGGNGDGVVSAAELDAYLRRTVTYFARRYYGRDQTPQMMNVR